MKPSTALATVFFFSSLFIYLTSSFLLILLLPLSSILLLKESTKLRSQPDTDKVAKNYRQLSPELTFPTFLA